MGALPRRQGVSSRISIAAGPRQPWVIGGVTVDLPVIVDWVDIEQSSGDERVRIEARVDLVDGEPAIVEMSFVAPSGLDLQTLQRDFRWASPLEVVTGILPRLLESESDPYNVDIPVTGFPAIAVHPARRRGVLTDEFLTTIAREYLARGRGYAVSMSREYFVAPRTIVSWVEKARSRGILSAAPRPGATGGHLITKSRGGHSSTSRTRRP